MPDRTVLVTGATGLVGGALVAQLLAGGDRVKAVAREGRALPAGVERIEVSDIAEVSEEYWQNVLKDVDVVVHAAALVHQMEGDSATVSDVYRKVNTEATSRLAQAAAKSRVGRFIFISTIKVLGESTLPGHPFRSSDSANPCDAYALSKWQAEQVIHEISGSSGMHYVIIRPPLCYGPGVQANLQALMKLIKRRLPLPFGAINNRRSLVSVYNLVDLIQRCLDHPSAVNETFLVSDGDDVSTTELVRRMGQAVNIRPRLVPVPQSWLEGMGRILGKGSVVQRLCGSLQIDLNSTKKCLDWVPPYPMYQGLQRTFRAEDQSE